MRIIPALAMSALVGLTACRKPASEPAPTEAARLEQAVAAGAARLSEADAKVYREGFVNGAAMVQSAIRRGLRPFLLRPKGPEAALQVELDPETGLEFTFAIGDGPYAQGQLDGFRFLFAEHRSRFTQPAPEPALPAAWEAWPSERDALLLVDGPLNVECRLVPRALAWSRREAGFPPLRRWRQLPPGLRPHHAALAAGVIWLDSESGAFAVDLESGVIRSVLPSQSHAPSTIEDQLAEWRKATARARPERVAQAMQGDLEAMVWLGQTSEDPVEAARWFRQAAEGGQAEGMFQWATRLYQGRGVAEDKVAARTWFTRALAEGHPSARQVLEGLFPNP